MNISLLHGILAVLVGAGAILQGLGKLPMSKDPARQEQRMREVGPFLKWSGAIILVGGMLRIFGVL